MAVKTVSNTGGNWSSASTWSPSGVPSTTADNVVFTSTSGPLVISATATIENINFSGYQNTVTFNWPLQVTGAFNLGTQSYTMSFDSTLDASGRPRGRIRHTDTATITTNNRSWQTPWQFYGTTETVTLSGDLTFEEDLYLSQTGTLTITGGSIITKKNVIVDSTAGITTGAATFSMQPITATWSSLGGSIRNNLRLEPSNFLFLGTDVYYGGRRLTTVNSNIGQTNSTLHIESTCTLDTSNIYWNRVLCDNSATTVTLASNLYIKGRLEIANTTVVITGNPTGSVLFQNESSNLVGDLWIYPTGAAQTFTVPYNLTVRDLRVGGAFNTTVNSNKIFINRNLWFNASDSEPATLLSGTTTFEMSGTGSIASLLQSYFGFGAPDYYTVVRNNIIINTTGTINLGIIHYQTGTFQKTAGTVVNGATVSGIYGQDEYQQGRLIINNTAAVINISGHTWNQLQIGHRYQKPASIVRTLTEDIICNFLNIGGVATVTINGTYSIYTRTGFRVGDAYTSFGAAQSIVLNGTSEIYCGEKNSLSTANVSIGTDHFRPWYDFFSGTTNALPGTAECSINVTVNTAGSLSFASYVWDDGLSSDPIYTYQGVFKFINATFSWINGSYGFQDRVFTSETEGQYGDVLWIDEGTGISHTTLKPNSNTFSAVYLAATSSTGSGTVYRNTVQVVGNFFGRYLELSPHQIYTAVVVSPPVPGWFFGVDTAAIKINTSSYTNSVTNFTRVHVKNPGYTEISRANSIEPLLCEHLIVSAPVYKYNTYEAVWPVVSDVNFTSAIISKTFSIKSDCELRGSIFLNAKYGPSASVSYIKDPGLTYGRMGYGQFVIGADDQDAGVATNINLTQSVNISGSMSFSYCTFRYFGGKINGNLDIFDYGAGTSIAYGTGHDYSPPLTLTISNYHVLETTKQRSFSVNDRIAIQNLYFSDHEYHLTNNGTASLIIDNFLLGQQTATVSFSANKWSNIQVNNYIGSSFSLHNQNTRSAITSTYSVGTATASRYVKLTVSYNAVQDLHFVNSNYVNSSEGATVWTYKGQISNSYNWNQVPIQPKTIITSFSS